MLRCFLTFWATLVLGVSLFAASESDIKKSQLEDIFIWKMSDELKLTAQQEKSFTEVSKAINKQKSELNKQIQETIQGLEASKAKEAALQKYRRLMADYNQLSLKEFDSIKKLLGPEKFADYIKIKNELTSKMKSILIGEKSSEHKDPVVKLPPPNVIVEK